MILLTPITYRVLRAVPDTWRDEQDAWCEIALAFGLSVNNVRRRLNHLLARDLIIRRVGPDGAKEIRRTEY